MMGDDGRVCRHAHCAGKDPRTGSVAFKRQVLVAYKYIYLNYYKGPEKNISAVEHFPPIGLLRQL